MPRGSGGAIGPGHDGRKLLILHQLIGSRQVGHFLPGIGIGMDEGRHRHGWPVAGLLFQHARPDQQRADNNKWHQTHENHVPMFELAEVQER